MTTNRLRSMGRILISACIALTIATAFAPSSDAQTPDARAPALSAQPNIVLIEADDLDNTLGTTAYMPNVQRLITQQGATFRNFFVSTSLCCPSRASLLRGQYVHNHGIYTNSPPDGGFQKALATGVESDTMATALQAAGYRTLFVGKYLNSYPTTASSDTYIPPGWSEWVAPLGGAAYDGFTYTLNDNGTLVNYGGAPQDYATDVFSNTTINFVTRTVSSDQPFFIYFSPYVPHAPATPAPRHAALFPDARAPRTPAFNEPDVSDKPSFIRALPLLTASDIADIDAQYRKRLQSVQAVDEFIASLVNELTASGQISNTYIFFTSDNGYHMGQHRLPPTKYLAYEEDIRLPLLVRGPGIAAGVTITQPALMIDLAPTFAELGGTTMPAFVDGRSLAPLLHGQSPGIWRQAILLEQYPFDNLNAPEPFDASTGPTPVYFGLHTVRYKYVEYQNGERELYDLVNDPNELRNVWSQAGASSILGITKAETWLHALQTCAAEQCRLLETAPPQVLLPVATQ